METPLETAMQSPKPGGSQTSHATLTQTETRNKDATESQSENPPATTSHNPFLTLPLTPNADRSPECCDHGHPTGRVSAPAVWSISLDGPVRAEEGLYLVGRRLHPAVLDEVVHDVARNGDSWDAGDVAVGWDPGRRTALPRRRRRVH
jgi:hypothetical protein